MPRTSQIFALISHDFISRLSVTSLASNDSKGTITMHGSQAYSRTEIQELIANGSTIVITRGRVLKLDAWLNDHPGGRLAIQHMVERDATYEIST